MTLGTTNLANELAPIRSRVSIRQVVFESYRFAFGHASQIFEEVWLPTVMMGLVTFLTLEGYFNFLSKYLVTPDRRVASIVIAALLFSFFVWLFLQVAVTSRVARIASDPIGPARTAQKTSAPQARLFAAWLRLLLVSLGAGFVASSLAFLLMHWLGVEPRSASLIGAMTFVGAGWLLCARCALLAPAQAGVKGEPVLRRAWALTRSNTFEVMAIWAALVILPGLVLQTMGNLMLGPFEDGLVLNPYETWAQLAAQIAASPWLNAGIALTLTISSSLCAVLLAAGSVLARRELQRQA